MDTNHMIGQEQILAAINDLKLEVNTRIDSANQQIKVQEEQHFAITNDFNPRGRRFKIHTVSFSLSK